MGEIVITPDDTYLGVDVVYTPVNFAFSATSTEPMVSLVITANILDPNINITNGVSSASITGEHTLDLFQNMEIKYVPPGSSDKIQAPIIANKTSDVPPDQEVFSAKSDPNNQLTVVYTVTATDESTSLSVDYTYTVRQTYDGLYNWLFQYFN